MASITNILGIGLDQVDTFKKDYREVWSGAASRITRPGLWCIRVDEGEIVVEVDEPTQISGYNVAAALLVPFNAADAQIAINHIADAIEEIGTPSAIEVAKHIREDMKNV